MRRKLFRGKDLREALLNVRTELGPDAVIFSTNRVDSTPGVPGLLDAPYVEVEAAKWVPGVGPDEDDPQAEEAPQAGAASQAGAATQTEVDEAPLPEMAFSPEAEPIVESPWDKAQIEIYTELCDSGMNEETAQEILARGGDSLAPNDKKAPAQLRNRVLGILTLLGEVGGPIRPRAGGRGPSVANFIGANGSGKTSIIQKIAAEFTLKRRLRVGLVAYDGFRMGGGEKLKVFAESMRLPHVSAYSMEELDAALKRFKGADVILVDTAGRSSRDDAQMRELDEVFGEQRPGNNYLVMDANLHAVDMARQAASFSRVPLHRLVFTKLDETSRFGVIFERHMELGVPLAYFTAGPRIPHDLEVATSEGMARKILPPRRVMAAA